VSTSPPSRVAEDYVTTIWKSQEWSTERLTSTALAARLGVAKSTVSTTLRRLAADGYVDYTPYGEIGLTPEGTRLATAVVRRHRLIETYLVDRLGLGWDEVHVEADLLEHAVSERVLEAMRTALGDPQTDPHGDPIPPHQPPDLQHAVRLDTATDLSDVRIVRVSDDDPTVLRYLASRRLGVGAVLETLTISTTLGVVQYEVDGATAEISEAVARYLWVVGT
jgi:DtxR family Mn-dependent transcriptional regulator